MHDAQILLVTGANRGIGLGFITALLLRPSTITIAAVLDPASASSSCLHRLPRAEDSRIVVIPLDSRLPDTMRTAMTTLKVLHRIDHIDVVIANAGINSVPHPPSLTSSEQLYDQFTVNSIGPLMLFQSVRELLGKSPNGKFVAVSSVVSSMGLMKEFQGAGTAYGASKAALNFIVSRIHYENRRLVSFLVHPGWVQTDMGNASAKRVGLEMAPVRVEDSVKEMLRIIDVAERQDEPVFISYDGTSIPW